jgi:hypothetical protein
MKQRTTGLSRTIAGDEKTALAGGLFHFQPIGPCRLFADTVAKVENRTTPKISRELIFRSFYRCKAP